VNRFAAKSLKTLWHAYADIQQGWKKIIRQEKEGVYQLLHLGSLLKETKKKYFTTNQSNISKISFQFKTFFKSKMQDEKLYLKFRKFVDIGQFEKAMFPADIHMVKYSTSITTGGH